MIAEKIEAAVDEKRVYESYYAFENRVDRLQPHQILALNRGEKEAVLRVRVEINEPDWRPAVAAEYQEDILSPFSDQLSLSIEDAAGRLLLPSIERDVRRELSEKADGHAINVFATNLRALLGQPPLAGQTVLGLDPGFRTGTKVAVVDPTGKLLDTGTIYPHEPKNDWAGALKTLAEMVQRHHVTLVTIGNGTASRETEKLVAELTRALGLHDEVSDRQRSRRLRLFRQSPSPARNSPSWMCPSAGRSRLPAGPRIPLAELVKIDPKSIGVGLYQHDVDQNALTHSLDGVVESVVNRVGVDVNTASSALLTHVAGIGPKLAVNIVYIPGCQWGLQEE